MNQPFAITGLQTITLPAEQLGIVIEALKTGPYNKVQPIIDSIIQQVMPKGPRAVDSSIEAQVCDAR